MGKSKKAERKHLSQTGTILFNGTLTLQLKGKTYQVRTEYHGLDLQRASQNHEVIVLIKQHLPYDEIDTGYIVRAKEYDKQHCFGLKSTKDAKMWAVYNYSDVIAWGYADGGLNSDHFDSCRLRPEDYPQFAGQPDTNDADEWEDDDFDYEGDRRCVKFKVTDDEIIYNAVMGKDEMMKDGGTPLMHACAKVFHDLRTDHPEVTEAHFYTDDRVDLSCDDTE